MELAQRSFWTRKDGGEIGNWEKIIRDPKTFVGGAMRRMPLSGPQHAWHLGSTRCGYGEGCSEVYVDVIRSIGVEFGFAGKVIWRR
jgi:hypothetical protein